MPGARVDLVHGAAAVVVVAASCPGALFGGALLGCASQGYSTTCALNGLLLSPLLLLATGLVVGLLTRGWAGLALIALGVVVGMVALFLLTAAGGTTLPVDPVQDVIAMIWFFAPTAVGYGVGRGAVRLVGAVRR